MTWKKRRQSSFKGVKDDADDRDVENDRNLTNDSNH